jgi:hypothetical protein
MTRTTHAFAFALLVSMPANAQYVSWNPIPAAGCSGYNTTVIPVGIAQVGGGRYLSYGGVPGTRIIPVAVSPDNGEALYLTDTSVLSQSNTMWKTVLHDLAAAGLNKLRVWVAFGSANDSRNTPFLQTSGASCPAGLTPCFRLDQKNQAFFDQLRGVVNEARKNFMFVEVTFFSPFNGDNAGSTFANGPWGGKGAYSSGGVIKPIQFTSVNNFVLDAQSGDNLTMQTQFQANVINWTVGELWCFDNIWYEIANEPEASNLNAARTANWEKSLIANNVVPQDSTANYPFLQRPHLIAVNTFSAANATDFLGAGNPNVSIVNGHYTEVVNGNDDTGALISLADGNLTAGKVLGLNETKITNSASGNAFTRSLTNGTTVKYSGPEAGRAEAWEFMLTRGGTVDHFGYLTYPPSEGTVGAIASQMNSLRAFMYSLPIGQLVASPDQPSGPSPSWVTIGHHPDPQHGVLPTWNSARLSYKYWGALQTPDGTVSPNRVFVIYLHNSAPRCKENGDTVNYDPVGQCSTHGYLPINSYDARIWTTTKYQESNVALHLGAAGSFRLCWIDPATNSVLSQQTCNWNGTACDVTVTSLTYSYDMVLKIDEKPMLTCP